MELVPRDLVILETVGELGTADTEILHRLHFPSDKTGRACQQRLRKLSDEGLLKRVRLIAVDGDMRSGSLPMMYFLAQEGADLVERETGRRPHRVTRSDPKPFTLRHRLDTVRARLAIDEAAKLAGIVAPDWIMEQDARDGHRASKGHSPSEFLVLHNRYQHENQTVCFRPDAACRLQVPHNGGLANLLGYFEVDRSTEGHLQWKRKLSGIEAFLNDPKAWQGHWSAISDPVIRVFVLCKSQRRINELIETTKPSPAGSYIRFTSYPLDASTALIGDVWLNCNSEPKRIIRGNQP